MVLLSQNIPFITHAGGRYGSQCVGTVINGICDFVCVCVCLTLRKQLELSTINLVDIRSMAHGSRLARIDPKVKKPQDKVTRYQMCCRQKYACWQDSLGLPVLKNFPEHDAILTSSTILLRKQHKQL